MALIEHNLNLETMDTEALVRSLSLGKFILEAMAASLDPRWPGAKEELERQTQLIGQEIKRRSVPQVVGLQAIDLAGAVNR